MPDSSVHHLISLPGTRCEIDLAACVLEIQTGAEVATRLPLAANQRSETPRLQSWGEGICLLEAAEQRLIPWRPGLRYGLRLTDAGAFLLRPEEAFQKVCIQTRQLIYPGFYHLRQAQGPFDMFCDQRQERLAVVNRGEAIVQIFDPRQTRELARRSFAELSGPKLVSVALEGQYAWICGPEDRRLWRWDYLADEVASFSGPWKHASAVVLQDNTLWLLDSGIQQTCIHALTLPELMPLPRLSVDGGSYALQTDAPGDWLTLSPDGQTLMVMSQVNLPAPLTPKVNLIQSRQRSADREFQPSSRGWPVMLAYAAPNRALADLRTRHALNRRLEEQAPSGHIRALLDYYGLKPAHFESSLVVLAATAGESDDDLDLRSQIWQVLAETLAREGGVRLALPAQQPLEQEIQIHVLQLNQLLKQYDTLAVALLRLLGCHSFELRLNRQDLRHLALLAAGETLENVVVGRPQAPAWNWVHDSGLPAGWSGLADPLNSRLLQLNDRLEVSWCLEANGFGVYRPLEVCWLPDKCFGVIDGERGRFSVWNDLGREVLKLEAPNLNWSRVLAFQHGEALGYVLLDAQQGRLFCSRDGEVQELADLSAMRPLDISAAAEDSLWLLLPQAHLSRCGFDGQIHETLRAGGHPSRIAASPQGALALYDGQVQKVSLWRAGQWHSLALPTDSGRYRISEPLGLQWRTDKELLIFDAFRLLVIDTLSGAVLHSGLIQELRLPAGGQNLAPEASFAAQADRNLNLLGGSSISLIELLRRSPLFQDVSRDFLRELIGRLRTQIYNRGDQIVRQGDIGQEMYLIRQGQVEVLDNKQQKVVARMSAGDLFGEVALMLGLPRNATLRAGSYCELFKLHQTDLDDLLPDYPEVKERLLQLAHDRQQQAQLRSQAEQEQLRQRIQTLMSQKGQPVLPVTRAAAARVDAERPLPPLEFWAMHPQSGQLARINRAGETLQLLGPLQGLVQPVAAQNTPHGTWVLDMGLNALLLLEEDRVRLNLERWNRVFLAQPRGMFENADGSLWIANTGCGELLLISAAGELLRTLSWGRAPAAVSVLDNGHLLVTDLRQHTVSEMTIEGEEVWRYGTPRSFGRDENLLFAPEYAQRLADGHTLITDTGNSRILEVDAEGRIVWSVSSATGLRVIRPTRAQRLASGHTLIEHSNHFYWLEITPEQLPVWRFGLPVRGFFFATAATG